MKGERKMDEQRRPRSREKKIIGEGKAVEKKGEGLGTGPVGNTGGYESRRKQQGSPVGGAQRPSSGSASQGRPQQGNPFGQQPGGFPFGQGGQNSQNSAGSGFPFGTGKTTSGSQSQPGSSPFGSIGKTGQNSTDEGFPFGTGKPVSGSQQTPYGTGTQKQYHSATKQNGTGGGQRANGTGTGSGGGGKLILIIIALVVLLGGGKLGGLFGGDDGGSLTTTTQTGNSTTVSTSQDSGGSGLGSLGSLLSAFMGGSNSSAYDYTGGLTGLLTQSGSGSGNTGSTEYFTASSDDNSTSLDESVSGKAREKYTVIRGSNKDEITILVYMCGTDLESQQGMATSDLKEMAAATVGKNVNLLVYTGGCSRWRNDLVSSRVNQIYRINNGKFQCLVEDAGNANMVKPETLTSFIRYGQENYPANRMCLIFWDHGGGSVSGYGYDEKVGHNQSMTLAGINTALKNADVKFDFIGFDACLMATVENGIMLSQYADYMIASEETEPGVGWYYTNWLTKLSQNTSMPTIKIGKQIADDFVEVCNRQCRGQATTLSVVDLAELSATIPEELKNFSIGTNDLIQNKEYKTVASARSKTREFAQQSRIDQIDLVDFAKNLKTKEGKSLAKALQDAVKYNKTGGNITHAYGLSIYFPYKQAGKVNQMVSTYQAIGMDEEYTRCIQEFASLEVSGQVSAGTPVSAYGSSQPYSSDLLGSLLGTGGGYNTSYSQGGLQELLGGMYGGSSGGSTGSILDLFLNRSMTADEAAGYIMDNHFDASLLKWQDGKITLPSEQWSLVTELVKNVFVDDGTGFIDLGCDSEFELNGNTLTDNFDGTWMSIDRQPVAYYYLGTVEEGDSYAVSGYVPAQLNGERVNLILIFDSERPEGYIAGAQKVYADKESSTEAKTLIAVGEGDEVQFLCDFYDYDGNFRDNYKFGDPITLGSEVLIGNAYLPNKMSSFRVTYRFTDIYRKEYWTPVAE